MARAPLPEQPVGGGNRWTGSGAYEGSYSFYQPSPQPGPIPPYPCEADSKCCEENPLCDAHKRVLYVSHRRPDGSTTKFPISYGRWECWGWYMERIEEVTGIPPAKQRIVFAGGERTSSPARQHSGLQILSTIHLFSPEAEAEAEADADTQAQPSPAKEKEKEC